MEKKLNRFTVKYIARDGYCDKTVVWAHTKGEARQVAEEKGCEDILKVRRAGFPVGFAAVIAFVAAAVVSAGILLGGLR